MKYKIITVTGIKDAVDAIPFRFRGPKWLANINFFTSRYMSDGDAPSKMFTVTEASSGRDVCRRGFRTRQQAKAFAQERFLTAASYGGVKAVKNAIRNQRLPR